MTNLIDTSKWFFIAGTGQFGLRYFSPEDNAQHVIDIGANGSYIGTRIDTWNTSTWVSPNGLTVKEHTMKFVQKLRDNGLIVYAQMYPSTAWSMDSDWTTQARNQKECINNNPVGSQDEYINWAKTAVADVKPDVCQIMNEVQSDDYPNSNPSEEFWNNYIAFCNRFMIELNAVNPNMIFTVSSIPFWDLTGIASRSSRFIVPNGCKLVFSYHFYYALWNGVPGSYEKGNTAYWNNGNVLTATQRANAKTIMANEWLNNGLQTLLNQGKQVIFDELGTNNKNPNFKAWMEDAIEFCRNHGIGIVSLNSTYPNNVSGWNQSPGALWDSPETSTSQVYNWIINSLGTTFNEQVINDNEPSLTVRKTFSGKLSAVDVGAIVNNVPVIIEVTGDIVDTLNTVTDSQGNYSIFKDFVINKTSNCIAVAKVSADITNGSVISNSVLFTMILNDLLQRTITLTVN